MASLKELTEKIRTWFNTPSISANSNAGRFISTMNNPASIARSAGQFANTVSNYNPLRWTAEKATQPLARSINTVNRVAPSMAQSNNPYYSTIGNFYNKQRQSTGNAISNTVRGLDQFAGAIPTMISTAPLQQKFNSYTNAGAGVGRSVLGVGQTMASVNPLVMGLRGLSSTPAAQNMNVNVPYLGKMNVPDTLTSMFEFSKDPAWKRIFPVTSNFLNIVDPKSVQGKVANFLLGRSLKGGTEGLIQGWSTLPQNATTDQKVNHYLQNAGFGVASEITFDTFAKTINYTGDKLKLKNIIANVADRLSEDVTRFKQYATEPAYASGKTKLQVDFEGRRLRNVSGAVNPGELVNTVKELQQDPTQPKGVLTPEQQAAKDFQESWSKAYGNRPETTRSITALDKTNFTKWGKLPEGVSREEMLSVTQPKGVGGVTFPLKINEGSYGQSKYPELSDQTLVNFAKDNGIQIKKVGTNEFELTSPTGQKINAVGREVYGHLEEMYKRTSSLTSRSRPIQQTLQEKRMSLVPPKEVPSSNYTPQPEGGVRKVGSGAAHEEVLDAWTWAGNNNYHYSSTEEVLADYRTYLSKSKVEPKGVGGVTKVPDVLESNYKTTSPIGDMYKVSGIGRKYYPKDFVAIQDVPGTTIKKGMKVSIARNGEFDRYNIFNIPESKRGGFLIREEGMIGKDLPNYFTKFPPTQPKGVEPLYEMNRMPTSTDSVKVKKMELTKGDKYAVEWIDKNGERQVTSKFYQWEDDAQQFANRLKESISTQPKGVGGEVLPQTRAELELDIQKRYAEGMAKAEKETLGPLRQVVSDYESGKINQTEAIIRATRIDPEHGRSKLTSVFPRGVGVPEGGVGVTGGDVALKLGKSPSVLKTASEVTTPPRTAPESTPKTSGTVLSLRQSPKILKTSSQPQQTTPSPGMSQGIPPQPPKGKTPIGDNSLGETKNPDLGNTPTYSTLDKLYTEFVDRFHPISKLAKKAGKDKEMARTIASYYGSGSTADYHLTQELSPILKGQNIDDLRRAAIAMRDVELAGRGVQGSNTGDPVKNLEALTQELGPEKMKSVGDSLQKLYAFQDSIVKRYLVDTGIISESSYNSMRKNNQFYIPFQRVMDQVDEYLGIPVKRGAGSVGSQNVIKGIKGSSKEIYDPIESIVANVYKTVSLGRRQEYALQISGLGKQFPDVVKQVVNSDGKNTVSLFKNGKKVFYSVPEEVADAARGMNEEQLMLLSKVLKVPTDLFRTMTTGVNPEFLLPNVSRDTQSALFNAGLNPLKWVSGLAHFIKRDDVYRDFLKSGGKTSRISINRPYLSRTAKELSGGGFTIKSPKDIVRGLEMLAEVSEQPTRIAVFKDAYDKALKNGLTGEEALSEAAYWAQEGTVNFARRGSKMTNINAIYAYLNARIQGIDRMFRTAKSNPGQASVRFGFGLLAPALSLYAWNRSNPDYYDERIVSKRDKQDNFIFMLPTSVGDIKYLKIPKSEIAKVTNPVEEFLDFATGKGGDVAKSILSVIQSMSPIDNWGGVIPTAINPLVENAFNKDFYTGYDLVPDYKKNFPAGFQDSNYTSPLFRMLGQKTNISPAKLQNLGESYGGGLMRVAEMATQPLISDQYVTPKNLQGAEINRTPVLRRFMGGDKKSEEEQAKSNVGRARSIDFDIRDITSGVKRGDIPSEVGVEKIQQLQQEQSKLLNLTGDSEDDIYVTRLQMANSPDGSVQKINDETYVYKENGEVTTLKIDPIPELKLTGNYALDKKARSQYKGKITKRANDVYKLYELGQITAEQADAELTSLSNLHSAGGSSKKITIKAPKVSFKLKKANFSNSPFKVKAPPKATLPKANTIRLKVDKKSLPAIRIKPPVNTLSGAVIKLV